MTRDGQATEQDMVQMGWHEISALFPGEGLEGLRQVLDSFLGEDTVKPESIRFGSDSRLLYRLKPGFTVDRPFGPGRENWNYLAAWPAISRQAQTKSQDTTTGRESHRSITFRALAGGKIWGCLTLFALAVVGRRALAEWGGVESEPTSRLEISGNGILQFLEALHFATCNLQAQAAILDDSLTRLGNDLDLLENEVFATVNPSKGHRDGKKPDVSSFLRRLEILEILLEEKSRQTEDNVADTLQLLSRES